MTILSESSRSSSTQSLLDADEAEQNVSYEVKFAINVVLNNFFISSDIKGNFFIYSKIILDFLRFLHSNSRIRISEFSQF